MFEMFPEEDVVFATVFDVHACAAVEDDGEWVAPAPLVRFTAIDAADIDW